MTGDQSSDRSRQPFFLRITLDRVRLAPVLAAAAFAAASVCVASAARADDGAAIFQSKCSSCHSIGKGKLVGPDLKGVTTTEDPTWLHKWISNPDAMVKSGDAKANALVKQYPMEMPTLGLSDADIDAVVGYISQQSGNAKANANGPLAPAASFPAGDSIAGRAEFVGGSAFKNGGPPCMSCHSISGIGALGGGTLGPDLTDAATKYGGVSGLEAFLTQPSTPTMSAVWKPHQLQPAEIANVVSFIKEATVTERSLSSIAKLGIIGVIVLALLVLIISIYWRGRLVTVRKALVQRANATMPRRYAGRI